jgi:hypothetical protein
MPGKDSPLLARLVRVPDTDGLTPITFDIELARGIVVTGRVIDKATGKGVAGGIRFVPLPDNKFFGKPGFDSYRHERLMSSTNPDGSFRLVVIPGSGVLMVQAHPSPIQVGGTPVNPYKEGEFTEAERKRIKVTDDGGGTRSFTAAGNALEFVSNEHALKLLDLNADAGTVTCDLFVDPGKTQKVNIQGPDGKPLSGTMVSGMTAAWPIAFSLKEDSCTVYALDPARPRQVVFLHPERKLAGTLMVRGDEKEPSTVRLVPTGTVTGRLLDSDGQPLAEVEVSLNFSGDIPSELYRRLYLGRPPTRTDRNGHFRLEGAVPDLKFGLNLRKGKVYLVGEPRIGLKQVGSGATLDMGDMRTKVLRLE